MKKATTLSLEFLAGIVGNLIAGWIQQEVWSNVFTLPRILGSIIGAILMLGLIVWLERSNVNKKHSSFEAETSIRNLRTTSSVTSEYEYDVFISYVLEDKIDVVHPLVQALDNKGLKVWVDELSLGVGDSLREAVDKGLLNSKYGIVVLSPAFLTGNSSHKELNGLFAREIGEGKVILPIWHNLSRAEVLEFSPMIADKFALLTKTMSVDQIADAIHNVVA